jgi:hypothetical protein
MNVPSGETLEGALALVFVLDACPQAQFQQDVDRSRTVVPDGRSPSKRNLTESGLTATRGQRIIGPTVCQKVARERKRPRVPERA